MYVVWKVKFESKLPSIEDVLEQLKKSTGIGDIQYELGNEFIVMPMMPTGNFKKATFSILFDKTESIVKLSTIFIDCGYLLEASLVALKLLGGDYQKDIDPLAYQKWEVVKDKYVQKSLLTKEELSVFEEWMKEKDKLK